MELDVPSDWTPLVLVVVMVAIAGVLFVLMQRQMKRLHANWSAQDADDPDAGDDVAGDPGAAGPEGGRPGEEDGRRRG
ncbi:hypothetical protein DT076_04175 [Desertihabitans brevis]|uniref:Uncharacterized protein n=1 Tax=Desertihabitans brevis TaxID=2268447 RepID=A0A367YXN7_9ACTN|nr:hypothetical protein [Desertihabitans brevis]RCK70624.1 hypothetical protein DT076_04175 [Desertihabitans brevis]